MKFSVLKNSNFRKLLLANMVNRFGDSVDSIAFTWITYTMTKSASLSALVFAANMLPMVLVQPLAAPIVDKMKKQGIMVWADILRGICLGGFILLMGMNLLSPWMFVAFTFTTNFIEAFRVPAGVSFVPKILEGKELDEGINMNQMAAQVCTIAGTAAGGILVAVSPLLAMGIDFLSFLISAVLIWFIRIKEEVSKNIQENTYWQNLKGGFQYLRKNRKFFIFVLAALLCNTLSSIMGSLMAAYINENLQTSANYLSGAEIILTVTSLLMMFFFSSYSEKIRPSRIFTWVEFGSLTFLYLVLAWMPGISGWFRPVIWVITFLIFGILSGMFGAFINVMFVKVVEEDYLSRAAGVFNSLGTLCTPVLSLGLAAVVKWVEIPVIFLGAAIISGCILLLLLVNGWCKVLDKQEEK